jgi:opacity protein-like surface antigen
VGSGWYLRGDIGYAFGGSADPAFRSYDTGSGSYGAGSLSNVDIEGSPAFGAGLGYRFTDVLRADVTVGAMGGDFEGSTTSALTCSGAAGTTGCRSVDTSSFKAYSLMVNGFADLGTFAGFTPYLGGGAGYTYVDWDTLDSTYYCVDGSASCASYGAAGTSSNPGADSWRFSYALMAGVAYDLSPRIQLDFGYKYLHIGSGDMTGWDSASVSAGATGARGADGGLSSHVFTIGVRLYPW